MLPSVTCCVAFGSAIRLFVWWYILYRERERKRDVHIHALTPTSRHATYIHKLHPYLSTHIHYSTCKYTQTHTLVHRYTWLHMYIYRVFVIPWYLMHLLSQTTSRYQDLCPDLATNIAKRTEITRILAEAGTPKRGIAAEQPGVAQKNDWLTVDLLKWSLQMIL